MPVEIRVQGHGQANGKVTATVSAHRMDGTLLHEDRVDLASAHARRRFTKCLAGKLNEPDAEATTETMLLQRLDELRSAAREEAADVGDDDGQPDFAALLDETPKDICAEAEQMLADPHLLTRIANDLEAMGIAGERKLATSIYLASTSRINRKPVSLIVQGLSSSGKSFVVDTAAELIPPEAKIIAKSLTPQALIHMPRGSLRHRLVVAGERSRMENDDTAEATRALREMLASGRLSKLMPVKRGDELESVLIEQEGPIAYIETTTLSSSAIFEEDLNRCLLLSTDETPEQTKRILLGLASGSTGCAQFTAQRDRIVRVHHAMQRLLAFHVEPVEIPFATRLALTFPHTRPEARRAFGHTLNFIKASAALHMYQRPRSESGAVVATADDYRFARSLLAQPLARSIGGGISDGARRMYDRLQTWAQGTFTTTEAANKEKAVLSDKSVRSYLSELARRGWLENVEEGRGPKPAKWRLPDAAPEDQGAMLPPVEEVFSSSVSLSEKPEMSEADATSYLNLVDTTI